MAVAGILAQVRTRAQIGLAAPAVMVEVHLGGGLPRFHLVGLPAATVREATDRVRAALQSSGFEFPCRRITVNLAPADLPKEGGRYDLPIAVAILLASGQLGRSRVDDLEFCAELGLDGALRPFAGALPVALAVQRSGAALMTSAGDASESAQVSGLRAYGATHLVDVRAHLTGERPLPIAEPAAAAVLERMPDLAEVRGQAQARRALEIAAAGAHHLLMYGPPGSGKSMLARRLPGLLPELAIDDALEVASVRSVCGMSSGLTRRPPFRDPHHSASGIALVGGGSRPRPGEISLAHRGVLFLDELPEFPRQALEMLREPMETGEINVVRANQRVRFPARFQLVAAMNPCPCGHAGEASGRCRCTAEQIQRYRARLSGPLLDRLDLRVEVPRVPTDELLAEGDSGCEPSETVRGRVAAARELAIARQACSNGQLDRAALDAVAPLDARTRALLTRAAEHLGLSARGCQRVRRVARTIADLAGADCVTVTHLAEAIGLRGMEST